MWTQRLAVACAVAAYFVVALLATGQRAASMLSLMAAIAVFLIAYGLRQPRDVRVVEGRVTVVDAVTKRELRSTPLSDVTLVRSGVCYVDVSGLRVHLARGPWSRLADVVGPNSP